MTHGAVNPTPVMLAQILNDPQYARAYKKAEEAAELLLKASGGRAVSIRLNCGALAVKGRAPAINMTPIKDV